MIDIDERAERAGEAVRTQARILLARMSAPADGRGPAPHRRLLVVAAGVAVAAVAVTVALSGGPRVPVIDGGPDPAAPVAVDGVLPVPDPGGVLAAYLQDGTPVFVTRPTGDEVFVLGAVSPHRGHGASGKLLAYCPSRGWFEDLYHGSKLTMRGDWLGGPAPTGLPAYPAEVAADGSTLRVTGPAGDPPARSDTRGERSEPGGPHCSPDDPGASHRPTQPLRAISGRDIPGDRWVWAAVVLGSESDRLIACDTDGTCPPDAPLVVVDLDQGPHDGIIAGGEPLVYLARGRPDGTVVLLRPARPDDHRAGGPREAVPADADVVRLSDDEVVVLAAAATNDPSLAGHVVADSDGLASVWRMGTVSGRPPTVPDGHIAVLVFARQAQSTCRSVDDVLGVEIRDGLAVVVLDPDGEFLGPCPGPDGAAAWTAFAVAIPDRYVDALTGADSRLADTTQTFARHDCRAVMSASVRGVTGTFPSAAAAARSVEELPDHGSLVELDGDGQHAVFGWVIEDELQHVIDTVRGDDGWTVGSYERCQTGSDLPADGGAWIDDDAKQAWDDEHGPGTWVAGYFLPRDFAYDSFDERQLVRRWLRIAADERNLDRASLLAESLAALPDAAPTGPGNSWQPYPGSPHRRLVLDAVHLDGDEVVLDFSELEASAPGTTAGMAMGLQFDAIVTHYYPEARSICVLVDGEPSSWLHDTMTCPSRQ